MIYSRQREAILSALASTRSHPTAEELYYMLKAGGEDISMATIYRNLGQLEEAGLVQRIIAGGPDRFDADMTKHYHAICTACGKTFDIFSDDMPDVCAAANRQGNIEVTDVRMIFGGMCKTCREKQQ